MTIHDLRGPVLAFLSLCLACAARSGDAGSEGSTGGGDASSSGDAGTATQGPTTTGSETSSETSLGTGGSTGDGSSSGDSGAEVTRFGDFALTRGDATITPPGCAVDRGEDSPWSVTLDAPTGDDGAFLLHESYGPYTGLFDCTSTSQDGFTCTRSYTVDYAAMGGPDARVQLDSSYVGTWGADGSIAGSYDAVFACTGTACDDATADWNLTAFPCDVAVVFGGTPVAASGA